MDRSYGSDQKKDIIKIYIDFIISISLWVIIFMLGNAQSSLRYLGVLLIFISVYQLVKVRFNIELLILFGIIAYINVSVAIGDCLQLNSSLGELTLSWQQAIRLSQYNVISAKCVLLLMSIINIFINTKYLKKIKKNANEAIEKKENPIIFWGGLLILLIFCFFGYETGISNTYASNTRTIYEYCLIIFIIVWFYSGKSKVKKYLLYLYAFIYISQAIFRGDRSSAFPMILILFLIIRPKIKIRTIVVLAILGIFSSNIISVYRETYSFIEIKSEYLSRYGASFFLSDTVSQSYYTSNTIIKAHDLLFSRVGYFGDFLVGIILGGGYKNADVGTLVYNYEMHRGGGFYYSWFYFWFGYIGVIIGSIVLGYVIRFAFSDLNNYSKLFKICLITMSLRWYLYSPFVLYRSVIFIFTSLILVCALFDLPYSKIGMNKIRKV